MKEETVRIPDPQSQINSMVAFVIEFFQYLWKHKIVLILIVVSAGVVGAMYNYYKEPTYTAKLTFALDEEAGNSGYLGLAEQFGISLGSNAGGAFKGENLLELFKSRNIIQKTLLSEGQMQSSKFLMINFLLEKEHPGRFNNSFFSLSKPTSYYQDSILTIVYEDIINNMLEVFKIDKRLIYVNVSFKSKDQAFSKIFVEKLLDNVVQYYTETKTMKAKKNVEVMNKELDSVRNLMTGAMYRAASSNDLNVNPLRQVLKAPAQRSSVDAQVYVIAYGEIMKNLEMAKLSLVKETPLVQVIDRPILPLKKEKKGRLGGFITWGVLTSIFLVIMYYILFLLNKRKKREQKITV